jgi:hypothetical protein|tara:strand:+ start:749 stop:949 length:201 start_codon:yes stop_codon:yes gene_type:complete
MIILITLDSGNTYEILNFKDLIKFCNVLKEDKNLKIIRFTSSDDEAYRFLQNYLKGVINLEIKERK